MHRGRWCRRMTCMHCLENETHEMPLASDSNNHTCRWLLPACREIIFKNNYSQFHFAALLYWQLIHYFEPGIVNGMQHHVAAQDCYILVPFINLAQPCMFDQTRSWPACSNASSRSFVMVGAKEAKQSIKQRQDRTSLMSASSFRFT